VLVTVSVTVWVTVADAEEATAPCDEADPADAEDAAGPCDEAGPADAEADPADAEDVAAMADPVPSPQPSASVSTTDQTNSDARVRGVLTAALGPRA
jgi:hypothetical protein